MISSNQIYETSITGMGSSEPDLIKEKFVNFFGNTGERAVTLSRSVGFSRFVFLSKSFAILASCKFAASDKHSIDPPGTWHDARLRRSHA